MVLEVGLVPNKCQANYVLYKNKPFKYFLKTWSAVKSEEGAFSLKEHAIREDKKGGRVNSNKQHPDQETYALNRTEWNLGPRGWCWDLGMEKPKILWKIMVDYVETVFLLHALGKREVEGHPQHFQADFELSSLT